MQKVVGSNPISRSSRPPDRRSATELDVHGYWAPDTDPEVAPVILLGLILLILGLIFGVSILYIIGLVLIVVGAALWLLGAMGRAVGGRRHYY
jgi:Family of unknown function (DUF6131)